MLWLILVDVWQKPTQHCKSHYPTIKKRLLYFPLKKKKKKELLMEKVPFTLSGG